MTSYVNGFCVQLGSQPPASSRVLLIQKARPDFQRGKWNGIGGKIEDGETPEAAMVREFREETGIETLPSWWAPMVVLYGDQFEVHFFRWFAPNVWDLAYRTVTDEIVELWDVNTVLSGAVRTLKNLHWILPLCMTTTLEDLPLTIHEINTVRNQDR